MQSTELVFEVAAQALTDPKAALTDAIEFDDLDTVLQPALPSANDAAPPDSTAEVELEMELQAQDIDALLGASGKVTR